ERVTEPRKGVRLPPGWDCGGVAVRAQGHRTHRVARVPTADLSRRGAVADDVLRRGPQGGRLRARRRDGARTNPRRPAAHLSDRNGTAEHQGRATLPRERPRSRVAVVVLPLEYGARRGARRACQPGQVEGSRGPRTAGPADAQGPAGRRA